MTVVLAPSGRIVDTALTAPTAACAKGSRRGHRYRPQAAPSRPRRPLVHSTCAQTGVIGSTMATATMVAWGRSTIFSATRAASLHLHMPTLTVRPTPTYLGATRSGISHKPYRDF
eukprot:jgi/Chrpa1/21604/Chrysochromulina_OHIO_Genome00020709-RA